MPRPCRLAWGGPWEGGAYRFTTLILNGAMAQTRPRQISRVTSKAVKLYLSIAAALVASQITCIAQHSSTEHAKTRYELRYT